MEARYTEQQLKLDIASTEGGISYKRFLDKYRHKYPTRDVILSQQLYAGEDDDGTTEISYALVHIKKGASPSTKMEKSYSTSDIILTACSYPPNWSMDQIRQSAGKQYKTRDLIKVKCISSDSGSKYVAEMYVKRKTRA